MSGRHGGTTTGQAQRPKRFLPSIATMSLGSAKLHALDTKLKVAASKGFLGIEMYWDDLFQYSVQFRNKASPYAAAQEQQRGATSSLAVLLAAADIAELAARLGLKITCLQPFRNFDGLTDPGLRARRLDEFRLWLATARRLGTDIIGVPSALPTVRPDDYTGSRRAVAADLAGLARLARPHGIRVAYENLCFAAHVRDWHQAWDAIQLADEPDNLLFLPDTFNLCGRTYMDPEHASGKTPNAAADLEASLQRLVEAVPVRRMPLLQVADAELPDRPLTRAHPWRGEAGLPALMALSRNARLFPFEERGYLPVLDVIQTLVAAGWEGWLSLEVFSRTTAAEGDETIRQHADRAWDSWEKLARLMGWQARPLLDGSGPSA
ncbi:4-hydroxyphenylpyruvate dioxygenase [Metarhizium album ARSEF 1941]|uniref:4-hydroxyphenylpyruvate dioxygenase n=1 Tax=Metarhizium album (strain ARSEF 1941) TaxID=1081103 RepID=A0A0B2WXI1_METAS|nr:4-hydroxyphenylpyruvate dioxygenase [Metarhizium album ARSEF 1941]KHN97580.1 4-hydroxyphenylpyruvate dioxygenase [Metarhizium album ARSEF 1941]